MASLRDSRGSTCRRSMSLAVLAAALVASGAACTEPPGESCTSVASPLSVCPAGAVARGIDVSVYQGAVDWSAVASSGIAFAFARVSDGVGSPDSSFAANWAGMHAAGLTRGAYQFFRAGEDPAAQAALVLSALSESGGIGVGDLPVVMDVETSDGESNEDVRAHMATWLGAIAAGTGKMPVLYTNAATAATIGSAFGAYPLWVAAWDTSCPSVPTGWSNWALWQYADTGSVAGIEGAVDLDAFNGTGSQLLAFTDGAPPDAGGEEVGTTTVGGDGGAGMAMGGGAVVDFRDDSTGCAR